MKTHIQEQVSNGFDSENLKDVRRIIEKHLKAAALECGIDQLQIGSIRYQSGSFSSKLSATNNVKAPSSNLAVEVGFTFKSKNRTTKYTLAEIREEHVIVETQRIGGKRYRIKLEEFLTNYVKVS